MRAKKFEELRRKVHAQCLVDLGNRLRHGSLRPTLQEICLGSFLDDIELQVRDAVLEMNRKGYCTWSSGFYDRSKRQQIDGPFVLDKQTISKLEEAGAIVKTEKFWRRNYTSIAFYPESPDTTLIKREWAKLVSLVPSLIHKAVLPQNYGSAMFWEQYVPYRRVRVLKLKRLIAANWNPRWVKRWKRQLQRI
ncbi:MAG: hypothetical protein Q8R55_06790 [Candidatus Taylorbacteria bacterium]|nr:hypothetical protein [Candidatus Taylorbacteria bacterium]